MTTDRVAGAALALVLLGFGALLVALGKGAPAVSFKQGPEFAAFFEADAGRLAEGVRKVGRIEAK